MIKLFSTVSIRSALAAAALARRFLDSDKLRCDAARETAGGAPESGGTSAETADAPKMKETK